MDTTLQQKSMKKVQLRGRLFEQELSPYITFIIPIGKVRIAAAMFLLTLPIMLCESDFHKDNTNKVEGIRLLMYE